MSQFIGSLPEEDAVNVSGAIRKVLREGLAEARQARHLRGDIWEVKVDSRQSAYRVLCATEGARGQVLLMLEAFDKKIQKTPQAKLELARQRLGDWRRRGAAGRSGHDRQAFGR